ncbi:MAG: MFS transporter [Planctomycetes bacterium]|nr:MFS transporter [Planctomycetota bacterium]
MKHVFGFLAAYWNRIRLFNRNIRLLLISQLISGVGISFYFLFFNLYLKTAGFDNKAIGNIQALTLIAAVLAALPAGYLAGRYSQKRILIIAQISAIVFFVAAMATLNMALFLPMIFAAFACETFIRVVYGPFIMSNSGTTERTYIFSLTFIIMISGGVFGNVIGGTIKDMLNSFGVESLAGYRYIIMGGMLAGLAGTIPLFFIRPAKHEPGEPDRKIKLSGFAGWNWKFFAKASIPSGLVGIGAGMIVQFINLYFRDIFNSSDGAIGFYMALQSVTMAAGVLIAPVLSEKLGKVNTIVLTQCVSIPFILVLALTTDIRLAVAAFIMRSVLMNMGSPISNTLLIEMCRKEEQGMLNAFLSITWSLSWAISAWVFGTVLKGNYILSFYIAVGLYSLSAIFFYIFFRKSEEGTVACKSDAGLSA